MSILKHINSTRDRRLAFSILTPPLLGSTFIGVFVVASSMEYDAPFNGIADTIAELISGWFMITILAYLLMGFQSIAAALTMELVIRPRIPNKRGIVIVWAVLGALSGASLFSVLMVLIGKATGLIIGLCMAYGFQPSHK